MHTTTLASAECFVSWSSGDATHRDWRYFPKLNFWRDTMPGDLSERMWDRDGELVEVEVTAGDDIPVTWSQQRRDLAPWRG